MAIKKTQENLAVAIYKFSDPKSHISKYTLIFFKHYDFDAWPIHINVWAFSYNRYMYMHERKGQTVY